MSSSLIVYGDDGEDPRYCRDDNRVTGKRTKRKRGRGKVEADTALFGREQLAAGLHSRFRRGERHTEA